MHLFVMLGKAFRRDVHAAIVARRLLRVTAVAVQRAAVEELFEPRSLLIAQMQHIARQLDFVPATITLACVVLAKNRSVVIVDAARHHAGPGTEWTRHTQLSHDCFANKSRFVGQLVEKLRQVFLDLKSNNLRLRRPANGHMHFLNDGHLPVYRIPRRFGRRVEGDLVSINALGSTPQRTIQCVVQPAAGINHHVSE